MMALRKYKPSGDASSLDMVPLNFPKKAQESSQLEDPEMNAGPSVSEADVDIDLREVYFLIMHFLSAGPCQRTYGQFWNELLEHQLLPRRYHAWYSRSGERSGDENDNGISFPLGYNKLVERYPHIQKDHLIKLLKSLILSCSPPSHGMFGGKTPNAGDVPTLLGSSSFSLLGFDRDKEDEKAIQLPRYLRWPHMQADQVRGISLREIGGGFTKHHRAPSVRAACYAIAKPSTMVQKMQFIKKLRGHQNAVYCAIFDRTGRYVITGSDDRLVKIWSMETAFCLSSCRGHEGDITDLAVSSNNALVASASNDFIIRVWRLPDGLPISVLRGHTGAVTAIAFSPRPSAVYQLLSSSDDGTCRIWDARYSQSPPRIYIPKPPDVVPGKGNDPSKNVGPVVHQILCCAYNASGTVFVTGSSDTFARVWNACKSNAEESEQPYHEMDLLSGHENDVNYVQFSGCAVASRSSPADGLKEDNIPKFKNSWFSHDNIVTCSRDGSAIIWIPRSRRSHGKVGRWTRAYHLKVPPPPMPPQPPRGGPRQRYQPTPRGVNMIVWSLDNRFVLAAIMDHRICVWNAADGSLVHSLIGHSLYTFVLDVHPFNPRIAMSAGYDGKTIIWDIWEGIPVRIYETGHFRLVDGKFSPDGTSIVLSDEVGQVFIITTGQGESQKDAQYDQFFLGDYRPLIHDTQGNVLDQETQLAPYRRNMQDFLCDSSMIPYPEPYQSMYQQRRLGALGIEWRPPSLNFAVGPAHNINHDGHDVQLLPFIDLDRVVEPLPEFLDAIDWEPENEIQSDDTDSEYNVTDECSSEGERESLCFSSSGDPECSAEDSEFDHDNKEGLRRSKRKKRKSEVEFTTSSGRRVKRRNLDERDGTLSMKVRKKRRKGRFGFRRKSSKSASLRPQRRAARNALTYFSQINGASTDVEEEDESETDSSENDSLPPELNQSNESDRSIQDTQQKYKREEELSLDECDSVAGPSQINEPRLNPGIRRLVLKLPARASKKAIPPEKLESGSHEQDDTMGVSTIPEKVDLNATSLKPPESATCSVDMAVASVAENGGETRSRVGGQDEKYVERPDLSAGFKDRRIKWGEVKARSSKRFRLEDSSIMDGHVNPDGHNDLEDKINGHFKLEDEYERTSFECGSRAREYNPDHDAHKNENQFVDAAEKCHDGGRNKDLNVEYVRQPSTNVKALPDDCQQGVTSSVPCNGIISAESLCTNDGYRGHKGINESMHHNDFCERDEMLVNNKITPEKHQGIGKNAQPPIYRRLRIKSRGFAPRSPSEKLKSVGATDDPRSSFCDLLSDSSMQIRRNVDEGEGTSEQQSPEHDDSKGKMVVVQTEDLKIVHPNSTNNKMYNAVYRRSKSYRDRNCFGNDIHAMEESTSNSNSQNERPNLDFAEADFDVRRTRSMNTRMASSQWKPAVSDIRLKEDHGSAGTSRVRGEELKSSCKMVVGLRSSRNRRGNYDLSDSDCGNRRRIKPSAKKLSWLMLLEHEEWYRYIPQLGDEVAYLKQGHQEYLEHCRSQEVGPWRMFNGSLRTVEFCRVKGLDYSQVPGSGESCCKLTLEFTDPSSRVFGKIFKMTLPELRDFSDFLVERTRYDVAMERNWTHRDKCQVWWRDDEGDGGSWYDGRVVQGKPKSSELSDSPWLRCVVQYKNDGSGHHTHCPWELRDPGGQWEHPHIDNEIRQKLLSSLAKIEQNASKHDYYGILKLKQVAQKSDYINRFPVPLSLEAIKRRLENNYYRTLDAVDHDIRVMLLNAESYFGRNAEYAMKIRRLGDWLTRTLSSL